MGRLGVADGAVEIAERTTQRLFIALALPQEAQKRFADLKEEIPGLKWTPTQSLHITLRFFGEIARYDTPGLKAALCEIKAAPFSLRITGLSLFARGPENILWAGLAPCAELVALKGMIDAAFVGAGIAPASGLFRPHITLGRMKNGDTAALRAFVSARAGQGGGEFTAAAFTLFSSILKPSGAEHFPEEVYPLKV